VPGSHPVVIVVVSRSVGRSVVVERIAIALGYLTRSRHASRTARRRIVQRREKNRNRVSFVRSTHLYRRIARVRVVTVALIERSSVVE
jgi:hypothetical protein